MIDFLLRLFVGLTLVFVSALNAAVVWLEIEPVSPFIRGLLIWNLILVGLCWLALRQCHKEKEAALAAYWEPRK